MYYYRYDFIFFNWETILFSQTVWFNLRSKKLREVVRK